MSSSFFDDMFSLPQPLDNEVVDGLPVVRLSEDAEVLNSLLITIASSGGLPSEMETLARLTLDFPMTFEYICDELPLFEGWALRDLIYFRKRCRDNLVSCFQSFLNLGQPPFNIWISCTNSTSTSSPLTSSGTGASPSWLTNLFKQCLTDLGKAFKNPLPNPSNIREEYLSALRAHLTSYACISCTKVHALEGETFCKELEKRLALAISTVSTTTPPILIKLGSLNIRPKLHVCLDDSG